MRAQLVEHSARHLLGSGLWSVVTSLYSRNSSSSSISVSCLSSALTDIFFLSREGVRRVKDPWYSDALYSSKEVRDTVMEAWPRYFFALPDMLRPITTVN